MTLIHIIEGVLHMIKMLVLDLDGTILNFEKEVSPRDIEAIKTIMDHGVQLTIATGRLDHEIEAVLEMMELKGKANRISQNGAFGYDKEGVHIHSHTFDPTHVKEIFQAAVHDELITTVSTEKDVYVKEESEGLEAMKKRMFRPVIVDANLADKLGTNVKPSKISLHGANITLKQMQQRIEEQFDHLLDTFISDPACLDLMPKDISKGAGIKHLLESFEIQPEEIACVGDSFNDLSMFNLTEHSYAMSQAEQAVKEQASHVVPSVAKAIESMFDQKLV